MVRSALTTAFILVLILSLAACGGGPTSGGTGGNGGGGNTAPATPTGFTATAGNAQVSLTWTASSGATTYNVKRATTSGGPYTTVSSSTTTSFTDTAVTNNTMYFYVVSAVNTKGESANCGEKSAKPNPPAPGAPTGLTATAGNAQVGLSWTASSGATSYNVKRSTTNGGAYTTINSPSTTSFNDTTVTNFTTYYYVVSAVNAVGESANSSQASAMPITIPAAPAGLTATAGNAQVSLTWTAVAGASSYKVKRGTAAGGPYSTQVGTPTSASFNDTTVSNGTTYFYVVTAVNAAGESGNSTEKSATPTLPAPGVPTNLVATAGDTQVSLSWTAGSNAASYHVKRSTTSGGPYTQAAAPTTTSYTDTGLTDGTPYYYVVSSVNATAESANSTQASGTPSATAADVTITVTPSSTHAISPWIYGINFFGGPNNSPPATMDRAGGNRWTAYNWENNYSNAGSDYGPYHNDNLISSSTTPAEGVRSFIAADHTAGLASLVTFQLQGFVSADGNGNVSVANPPDMTRFKTVVDKKSTVDATAFTVNPPTTDANVYMDEFIWTLDQKFSGQNIFGTTPALPTFVELDNEPELWNSTHLEVQGPNPVTSDNYITKTINLTKALKDQFPNVTIFGPVHYGFQGLYNWQGELSSTPSGSNWFPDKYLQAISTASTSYGKPLVDVYDFHWYPEVYDASGNRIISLDGASGLTDAQVQQIVQAPRDLWDPTWHDPNNSNPWVYQELGSTAIRIIPRLQAKINAEFPSMKGIAITEYEGGGWNHIAGTIAQADMLGVFGVQNLFAASMWPPNGTYDYALAGYRAFRSFDGANANFGDTSVQATSSDVSKVALYASTDSKTPGRVVFVAINRTKNSLVTAINGQTLSGTATIYQMTATTASGQSPVHPVLVGTQAASGTSLKITLPALSVTTIDVH